MKHIEYKVNNFYRGIKRTEIFHPFLKELFYDIPKLEDTKCEDCAILLLIDTIAVKPPITPEKLNFKQRVNFVSNGEVVYTLPNEDTFGWKKLNNLWYFWYSEKEN